MGQIGLLHSASFGRMRNVVQVVRYCGCRSESVVALESVPCVRGLCRIGCS